MFYISSIFSSFLRKTIFFIVAILTTLIVVSSLSAQVLVSPTVIIIADENPTGRMTLLNQSPYTQEITGVNGTLAPIATATQPTIQFFNCSLSFTTAETSLGRR